MSSQPYDAFNSVEDISGLTANPEVDVSASELTKVGHRSSFARVVEAGVVGTEISGLGGIIRYGGFAAVYAATKDPVLSTGYLVGSTALIEGGSSASTADILQRNQGENRGRILTKIDNILDKVLPKNRKVSPAITGLVTYYGGVAPLLVLKDREDPNRNFRRNLRTGIFATAAVTAISGAQGVAAAEGLSDPSDPKKVAPIALIVGSTVLLGRITKKFVSRERG